MHGSILFYSVLFSNYRLFLLLVQWVNWCSHLRQLAVILPTKTQTVFQKLAFTSIETRLIESWIINQIQYATG